MSIHFSSKSYEWSTPQALYDSLNAQYGFTIDACASADNHKCARYYTKQDDGLSKSWAGERVFMNPPYGREVGRWVKKASEEIALTVALLPARTDTVWFHKFCLHRPLKFLKGRLTFAGAANPAPFPSMVVVFQND
jgi:site-specific DNA-methyltransferase (adenine-specific)